MNFQKAPDIQAKLNWLLEHLDMPHVDGGRIIAYRSTKSSARAYARIWSLPRIWQDALEIKAHYVIEVLSEKFDSLNEERQLKVLIHELMHIPKSFSGALVPHKGAHGRHHIHHKKVDQHYKEFIKSSGSKPSFSIKNSVLSVIKKF